MLQHLAPLLVLSAVCVLASCTFTGPRVVDCAGDDECVGILGLGSVCQSNGLCSGGGDMDADIGGSDVDDIGTDAADTQVDSGEDSANCETILYPDTDDDGYGDADAAGMEVCEGPLLSPNNLDCDDNDDDIHPDADELCDEIDNDCDREVDENLVTMVVWPDEDMDGYGDQDADSVETCNPPEGTVENGDDCDDTTDVISPGDAEIVGNDVDEDCDGTVMCFVDFDEDGARTEEEVASDTNDTCTDVGEASAAAPIDCDDMNADRDPDNELEICGDGIDNNCEADDATCRPETVGGMDSLFDIRGGDDEGAFGYAMLATDLNGDDVDDLIIGDPFWDDDPAALLNAGGVFIFYGPIIQMNRISASSADVVIIGPSADSQFGAALAVREPGAGETLDLLIGAPTDAGGGAVYLVSGPIPTEGTVTDAMFLVGGDAGSEFGTAIVSFAPSAEPVEALWVGAPGAGSGGSVVFVTPPAPGMGTAWMRRGEYTGTVAGGRLGEVLLRAQLDGTGDDELIFGAPGGAGSFYIMQGPPPMAMADVSELVAIQGEAAGGGLSTSLCRVGDFNADGLDDFAVGAPTANFGGSTNNGIAYLVLGSEALVTGGSRTISQVAATSVFGRFDDSAAGTSCSGVPDMDGDGFDDLSVYLAGQDGRGQSTLFWGTDDIPDPLEVTADTPYFFGAPMSALGTVSTAGDVTGDGVTDLIYAQPFNEQFVAEDGVGTVICFEGSGF